MPTCLSSAGVNLYQDRTDYPQFVPLLSPRLFISVMGEYDGPADRLHKARKTHADSLKIYEADGAADNFVLLTAKMGHFFADVLKWKAYRRLKEYFGVLSSRTVVDLGEIVTEAREASRWMPEEEQGGTFPKPQLQGSYPVSVNRGEIVSALAALFLYVSDQVSQVELRVSIEEDQDDYVIDCHITTDPGANGHFEGASYQTLREVERILSEHDTVLRQDRSGRELRYQISFPKAK